MFIEPEQKTWHEHVPKVAERACPVCGLSRPADWYAPGRAACWKCRALGRDAALSREQDALIAAQAEEEGAYAWPQRRRRPGGKRICSTCGNYRSHDRRGAARCEAGIGDRSRFRREGMTCECWQPRRVHAGKGR